MWKCLLFEYLYLRFVLVGLLGLGGSVVMKLLATMPHQQYLSIPLHYWTFWTSWRNVASTQLEQFHQISCRNAPCLMQTRRRPEESMTSAAMLLLGWLLFGGMTTASSMLHLIISEFSRAADQCQQVVIVTEEDCHHSSSCTDHSLQPWNGWYWSHGSQSQLLPNQNPQQEVVVVVVWICYQHCREQTRTQAHSISTLA